MGDYNEFMEILSSALENEAVGYLNEILKIRVYIDERIDPLIKSEGADSIKRSTVEEVKKAIKDMEHVFYKLQKYIESGSCLSDCTDINDPIIRALKRQEKEMLLKTAINVSDDINNLHNIVLCIVSGFSPMTVVEDLNRKES